MATLISAAGTAFARREVRLRTGRTPLRWRACDVAVTMCRNECHQLQHHCN